jgi:hypothetical protein
MPKVSGEFYTLGDEVVRKWWIDNSGVWVSICGHVYPTTIDLLLQRQRLSIQEINNYIKQLEDAKEKA